eukprot:scaffold272802_cov51-Attheya_sp.AAC.1
MIAVDIILAILVGECGGWTTAVAIIRSVAIAMLAVRFGTTCLCVTIIIGSNNGSVRMIGSPSPFGVGIPTHHIAGSLALNIESSQPISIRYHGYCLYYSSGG